MKDVLGNPIRKADWVVCSYNWLTHPELKFCRVLRVKDTIQTIGFFKAPYTEEFKMDNKGSVDHKLTNCLVISEDMVSEEIKSLFNESKYFTRL